MGGRAGDRGPSLYQRLLITFRTYCLTSWIQIQLHVHRMRHPCQREKAGTQPSCGADGGLTPCPEEKERNAGQEWGWQWLFPHGRRCRIRRRHAAASAIHSPRTSLSRAPTSARFRSCSAAAMWSHHGVYLFAEQEAIWDTKPHRPALRKGGIICGPHNDP
jgi:hypothetical protein